MYTNTSESYKLTAKQNARNEYIEGLIGSNNFDSSNLLGLTYSNRCSDSSDLTLGSVYVGQIEAEFINTNIERGQWNGKKIIVSYGLDVGEELTEFIPCGEFTIASAQWNKQSVKVVAYDAVSLLDKPMTINTTNGNIYELANLACSECGVEFANTLAEIEAMPNGMEIFGLNPENDLKTWRDFMSKLAQLVGGFVTATRDGKIKLVTFANLSQVDTIGADGRLQDSTFSDFSTKYIGITMLDRNTGANIDVTNGNHSGVFVDIGDNPLLTYGLEETKERQRKAIANAIKNFEFVPFTTSLLTNPAYDLGDLIEFTGGTAGEGSALGCAMSIVWTLHQTIDLEGFGANPNLAQGESRAEKAAAGATATARGEGLTFFTYSNASSIAVSDEFTRISKITFVNVKETTFETWTQVQLVTELANSSESMTVTTKMLLDGNEITFYPTERINDSGPHLFHILWNELLTETTTHTFEVWLKAEGGTLSIDIDNARTVIKAQGITVSRDWDGFIDVSDQVEPILLGLDVADSTESSSIDFFVPLQASGSDSVPAFVNDLQLEETSEEFNVQLVVAVYDLITEDGEQFITEEGDALVALGG